MDDDSVVLFDAVIKGNAEAAVKVCERYTQRLQALARNRLSARIQRRVGPDDVVQTAFATFFLRALKQEFQVEKSGDLWRLLAAITVNKARSAIEFHASQKRTASHEAEGRDDESTLEISLEEISREPAPDTAAILADEVRSLLQELDADERQALEYRLKGATVEEIAVLTEKSQRTVRRILERARELLEARLAQHDAP